MTSPHPWISDRTPTRDDADVNNFVEVRRTPNGKQGIQVHWQTVVTGQQWRFNKHWQDPVMANQLPMGITKYCGICNYWSGQGKDSEGFCRRYAPRPHGTVPPDKEFIVLWPTTWDDHWCGEWEARQ